MACFASDDKEEDDQTIILTEKASVTKTNLQVIGTDVLVVEIIGMLPHVNAE